MVSINAASQNDLPYAERGPYPVGTRNIVIEDDAGSPINATVWYPARNPNGAEESAVYQQLLFRAEGRAIRDGEVDSSGAPYPLVLYSHGSGSSRWLSLFLTEHLASYGFVVVAPEHAGNTVFDAVRAEAFAETVITSYVTRPRDVLRTIAYVETLDWLAGVVDMERIAVTGYSFGGYTALSAAGGRWDFAGYQSWCDENAGGELDPYPDVPFHPSSPISPDLTYGSCFLLDHVDQLASLRDMSPPVDGLWDHETDPRIQAVAVFAPWNGIIWGEVGLAEVTIPALVMVGTADQVAPGERDAYRIYERLGSEQKTLVTLDGANHFIFSDECPPFFVNLNQEWNCTDSVWDMADAHAIIQHTTTAFLLSVLYADETAAQTIPVDVDGVTIISR